MTPSPVPPLRAARRAGRGTAVLAILALVAAACAPAATVAPSTPPASGTPACTTAPAVPNDLEGWGPPATPPAVIPILISPAIATCGPNRVLIGITDQQGRPIGAPDISVRVSTYSLGRDPSTPISTEDAAFVWAIEDHVGVYVVNVRFPEAGRYGAEITTAAGGGAPASIRLTFDVQPSSPVVKVGDPAPASETPTLADVGGDAARLSTDPNPLPALYEVSVADALAAHEPFVVVFATPKFCATAQCGPTLERIKPFVARYPDVVFINVEPYKLEFVDGSLQADLDDQNQLQVAPATKEWRLFNEPTVYVVDRDGIVTANFELIFSDAEMTAALDAVQ